MSPTIRAPIFIARRTFARLSGLINARRRWVSAALCHSTPAGKSSTISANLKAQAGGAGSRHQTHAACSRTESFSYALTRFEGCHTGSHSGEVIEAGAVIFL